jgi:hypothetical protein
LRVKKLIKFVFVVSFVFGGWALAAASLHVVRAPGEMGCAKVRIPVNVQLVPKTTLTFKETFVDTRKWTAADVAAHPVFVDRLHQANKLDLVKQAMETPAPSDAHASAAPTKGAMTPPAAPATPANEQPAPKSIFDFQK